MKSTLKAIEKGQDVEIDLEFPRTTPKKLVNWKFPFHDGIDRFSSSNDS